MKYVLNFIGGAIGAILGFLVLGAIIFLSAIGAVGVGWLVGYFAELVFNGYLTDGINALIGTTFGDGDLPKITATLWFLGYLVRGGNKFNWNSKKKETN